jgi:hypothetical protein
MSKGEMMKYPEYHRMTDTINGEDIEFWSSGPGPKGGLVPARNQSPVRVLQPDGTWKEVSATEFKFPKTQDETKEGNQ